MKILNCDTMETLTMPWYLSSVAPLTVLLEVEIAAKSHLHATSILPWKHCAFVQLVSKNCSLMSISNSFHEKSRIKIPLWTSSWTGDHSTRGLMPSWRCWTYASHLWVSFVVRKHLHMYNACYQTSTTEVSSLLDVWHPNCDIHLKVTLSLEQDIQLGHDLLRDFPIPQVLRITLYITWLDKNRRIMHGWLLPIVR